MRVRDENKEQLVRQKALEMLVKEGFNGFSMQKLAKAANVSPATLYIYYKDKDDLIVKIGIEEGLKMKTAALKDFDPAMHFEEGLRLQWKNRSEFWLNNRLSYELFELLRQSSYKEKIFESIFIGFKETMKAFVMNAVKNGELKPMPVEVYWSMAFAPLNNLIRFHIEGRSLGNMPFTFSEDLMWQTFDLVIKALKP
ncbi:TetR/AcrR family transcriptional regulator [Ferruginibacter sp. SUN002]|uniref:TetR/AcrR family transcriptional regulator n=1 Tax=Ferruginibacter sp. SUN002 TaxID=2937789 RepID=UPI003D35ED73